MSMSAANIFNSFITGGGGDAQFPFVLASLANNASPMPDEVCALLNLPSQSSYNAAYVYCTNRTAAGLRPVP